MSNTADVFVVRPRSLLRSPHTQYVRMHPQSTNDLYNSLPTQAKINRQGALEWASTFGGKKDELGVDIVIDPKDNGPIVVIS